MENSSLELRLKSKPEMSEEYLIEVNNVSKKFAKDLKTSLKYGLKDLFTEVRGKTKNILLRPNEFYAVKDISFKLKRGECLGVIGHNGAGKSTLLKLLTGIYKPDQGSITIKGKVSALIELGSGFNPVLTGRENIYINGSILGLNKEEVDTRIGEIIDFSGIEEFIDTPVGRYSSGMKVRLGFAVASVLRPDVLILDEVLAVGDMAFKAKCHEKIWEMIKDTAVIFVSHNMAGVGRICTRTLNMSHGEGLHFDSVEEGINNYYKELSGTKIKAMIHNKEGVDLFNIKVFNDEGTNVIKQGGDFKMSFNFRSNLSHDKYIIYVNILNFEMRPVAFMYKEVNANGAKQDIDLYFQCNQIPLTFGFYTLAIAIYGDSMRETLLWHRGVGEFEVDGENHFRVPVMCMGDWIISDSQIT